MAVENYLVEGISGSGKSSVRHELQDRGYDAVSGDRDLAYNGDPETGEPVKERSHQTWIWDVTKVKQIVDDKSKPITFFCGGSRNFDKFISLLDEVFILNVDDETIKNRLSNRSGNTWGQSKEELEMILRLNATKEDLPKNGIQIDATKPLSEIIDEIVLHVR